MAKYRLSPLLLLLIITLQYDTTKAQDVSCPSGCQSCDADRVMCRGASLTSVPTELSTDTYMVDLTQNAITSLEGLPDLPNAQSLRLSFNQLTVIEGQAFKSVPQLMSLDLSMNKLTKVYAKGFKGLENLMTLSLNMNKLTSIGGIFKPTTSLTSLRLAHNEITNIEEENFQKNNKIKMLDLSHNKIKSIHADAFKSLDMLRYLILSNNPLTTISDLTLTSTILSLADFSNCMLTAVPRTMPPSLNDFRLGNNKITKIYQDDFKNITNLRILFLNDNEIADVEHRAFSDLENLRELWLSRNMLVYIPRGLPTNLEKLQIDNNRVVELEQMLFKNGSKLMKLSLESNNVRKVHQDALQDVKDLNELNLQGNEISLIDVGTFTNVPNLKVLKLTQNPIQIFESGAFENMESLSEIYLSYLDYPVSGRDRLLSENFLSAMPILTKIDLTSSVRLTKKLFDLFEQEKTPPVKDTVKTVILQYNELSTMPASVQTVFPSVENLILDGNPFTCDKRLVWLHSWMSGSSVNFHSNEELACNKPFSLKGKLLSELQADEFVEETAVEAENMQPNLPVPPVGPANVQPSLPVPPVGPSVERPAPDLPDLSGGPRKKDKTHNTNKPEADVTKTVDTSEPDPTGVSKGQSNTNQPSRSRGPTYGVNVIIKPPSGDKQTSKEQSPAGKPNKRGGNKKKKNRGTTKAERQAARAKKRKEQREQRKKNRKNKNKKNGDKNQRRKKRRIRGKNGRRCKKDKEGNTQCTRKKRCKVDEQGHVICRKRGGRKEETKITPDILNKN